MEEKDSPQRDKFGRIVFDIAKNEELAKERLKAEKTAKKKKNEKIDPSSLKPLNVSLEHINLSRGINKRKIIGENIPTDKIGNWSCPICQLYFKDSNVYLKHLTSPEHNEKLGMSLAVQPATDEEVIQRIQQWEDFYIKGIPVPPLYQSGDQNDSTSALTSKQLETNDNKNTQKDGNSQKPEQQSKDDKTIDNKSTEEYEYEYEYVEEEEEEESVDQN